MAHLHMSASGVSCRIVSVRSLPGVLYGTLEIVTTSFHHRLSSSTFCLQSSATQDRAHVLSAAHSNGKIYFLKNTELSTDIIFSLINTINDHSGEVNSARPKPISIFLTLNTDEHLYFN